MPHVPSNTNSDSMYSDNNSSDVPFDDDPHRHGSSISGESDYLTDSVPSAPASDNEDEGGSPSSLQGPSIRSASSGTSKAPAASALGSNKQKMHVDGKLNKWGRALLGDTVASKTKDTAKARTGDEQSRPRLRQQRTQPRAASSNTKEKRPHLPGMVPKGSKEGITSVRSMDDAAARHLRGKSTGERKTADPEDVDQVWHYNCGRQTYLVYSNGDVELAAHDDEEIDEKQSLATSVQKVHSLESLDQDATASIEVEVIKHKGRGELLMTTITMKKQGVESIVERCPMFRTVLKRYARSSHGSITITEKGGDRSPSATVKERKLTRNSSKGDCAEDQQKQAKKRTRRQARE